MSQSPNPQYPGYQGPNPQYPGYQGPAPQQPNPQYPGYRGPNPQYPGHLGPAPQPPHKQKKSIWGRWWMICAYVIVGIIVIANLGGGGHDTAAPVGTDATSTVAAGSAKDAASAGPVQTSSAGARTTQAAKKPGIGTPVTSANLTLTITKFTCGVSVSDGYQSIEPQGQFCKMSVIIKNDGSQQQIVDDSQLKVEDAKGNEYGTSSDTTAVDGNIFLEQVNPGNRITGVAYFDVPKGVRPTTATFKGSLFSSAAEVSLS